MVTRRTTPPKPNTGLDIPCTWGGVLFGDKTVRIGFTASRGNLSVASADRNLCGKRLKVSIIARSSGGSDQESLPGADDDLRLTGWADVKNYGVSPKSISAGLTFMIDSVDGKTLSQFAKRDGCVTVHEAQDLSDEGDDDE